MASNSAEPLPGVLAEIEEVIGRVATLALAEAYGGTAVYIPASAQPDHWLAKTVGIEAAAALCRYYRIRDGRCGVKVILPRGPTGLIARARARVDRMIAAGKPAREIALASGYTTRGVEKRAARLRQGEGTSA